LAQTKSIQAAQTNAHGFEMIMNNHRSIENSQGYEQTFSSEERAAFSRINNAVSDFAQEHGITREKSAEILAGIGMGANLGIGKDLVGGNASLSGNAQFSGRSTDQDHYKAAISYSSQHNLSKDFSTVESAIQSSHFNFTDSKGESINQTFNNASSLNKEAGEHFENAKRYSEQQQYIKSNSAEIDRNYNQELWGELVNKYGEYGAAKISNPSNYDKDILNQEIGKFIEEKAGNVVQKPNLLSEYRSEEARLENNHNSNQASIKNAYSFSENTKQIDNSHLQSTTSERFADTKQKIDNAQSENIEVGNKVINKVKKEEDEGLF
jgi:hypothetical protein